MDWKSWFKMMHTVIPKLEHNAFGTEIDMWETMYQAFKARMLEEMKGEELAQNAEFNEEMASIEINERVS